MGRRGDGEKGEGVFQSSMTFSLRESRFNICGFSIGKNARRANFFRYRVDLRILRGMRTKHIYRSVFVFISAASWEEFIWNSIPERIQL